VFPVGDSLVAVDDFRDLAFELFDKETGEFVGRRSRDGAMGGTVLWSAAGDTLWLGFPDFPGGDFSAFMWVPRTNQLRHLWRVPRIFRDHPSYFSMGGLGTTLARWGDKFLLDFGALPHLYVVALDGRDGTYVDSLRIPVRRRRRIDDNIVEIAENRTDARTAMRRYSYLSFLAGIYRRADGSYLLVHTEMDLEGTPPAVERRTDYYLSVLTADLAQACVDTPLDLGSPVSSIVNARGDTLFALLQRAVAGEGTTEPRAETWVKRSLIEVDRDACEWASTGFPGSR